MDGTGENIIDDNMLNDIGIISTQAMEKINKKFSQIRQSFGVGLKKTQSTEEDSQSRQDFKVLFKKLIQQLEIIKNQIIELINPSLFSEKEKTKQFFEYYQVQVHKFKKTIMLRQSQLDSLTYILQNKDKGPQKYILSYKERYGQLGKFVISPSDITKQINIHILQEQMQTQLTFLEDYSDTAEKISYEIFHKKYEADIEGFKRLFNRLKIINSKIVTIAEIFPYACTLDTHDLFTFPKKHKRWTYLLENFITIRSFGKRQHVRQSFEVLKSNLNLVNATMSIMHKNKDLSLVDSKNWPQLLKSTNKILKCAFFKEDAHHQAQVLISDPDSKLAKEIWNLPQQKMLKNLVATGLPLIQFSKEMFIPRIFKGYLQNNEEKLPQEVTIYNHQQYAKQLFVKKEYEERILMRINSPYSLKNIYEKAPSKVVQTVVSLFKKQSKAPDALIYHIHGGGFISMSSFVHQTYTRVWANNLKVPIISVDYGKAPEYPFPAGLNDCFEGYMWTLYIFRQIFELQPKKIILVGDSAGGNLVAALTNLLIMKKLRVPDGLVLVYPALNLNYNNYTPSLLTSLNDMILPHTFLKICLQAYLNQNLKPETDPLLSPIRASDQILSQYPETKIFVGSKDPFHDDCCRLCERLNLLEKGKANLTVFQEFPHGFLQFDMKTQPHYECRKATKQVQEALGDFINC